MYLKPRWELRKTKVKSFVKFLGMQPHKIFYVSKQLYCSKYKSQIYQDDEKVVHEKTRSLNLLLKILFASTIPSYTMSSTAKCKTCEQET